MIVDAHDVVAIAPGGVQLDVLQFEVTADETWAPFVQARLVCAMPAPAVLDALDPRAADPAVVTVTVRRDFGDPITNAELTAAAPAGASNAQLTAMYAGMTGGAITSLYFRAWNAFGVRDSDTRTFELRPRDLDPNSAESTLTLQLHSDELLLQDHALVAAAKFVNVDTSLRALVASILDRIGAQLQPGTHDATIAAGALEWTPGQSAWAFLQSPIETTGSRLWCDELRRWWLTERTPLAAGMLTLGVGAAGTLLQVSDRVSRDAGYAEAVVIEYRWLDEAGAQQLAYDVAGELTASKVLTLRRDQKYPGPGAAAQVLKQSSARGRVLTLDAIADYRAAPGQAFAATVPPAPTQTGVVSAVTWQLPAGVMQVSTRDLIDTPATAWAFDPAGVSWAAIPAGTDWTED